MSPTAVCTFLVALAFSGAAHAGPAELAALARAYEHGEGAKRDPVRAAELYCDAAREGHAEAAYALGWMHLNGRGVLRDDATAAALFAWAAELGSEYGQRILARLAHIAPAVPECLRPTTPPTAWGPPQPEVVADAQAPVADPFASLPKWKQQVADLVGKLAPRYGIDTKLALSVIAVESNFEVLARSPKDARGLMQLIPDTAARYNVRNAFDPRQNVEGGLAYLRFLLAYYRGDVVLAAAAYNAGEKAVDRHGGVPPFVETQDYVRRVLALYRSERHPFDPRHAPSPSAIVAFARVN